jgi:hypothetical protein
MEELEDHFGEKDCWMFVDLLVRPDNIGEALEVLKID